METYYSKFPLKKPYIQAQYIPEESEDGDEAATGTSGCECEKCSAKRDTRRQAFFQDYDEVDPKGEPPNRDNFFFLMPEFIPAFILNERTWGKFSHT